MPKALYRIAAWPLNVAAVLLLVASWLLAMLGSALGICADRLIERGDATCLHPPQ